MTCLGLFAARVRAGVLHRRLPLAFIDDAGLARKESTKARAGCKRVRAVQTCFARLSPPPDSRSAQKPPRQCLVISRGKIPIKKTSLAKMGDNPHHASCPFSTVTAWLGDRNRANKLRPRFSKSASMACGPTEISVQWRVPRPTRSFANASATCSIIAISTAGVVGFATNTAGGSGRILSI